MPTITDPILQEIAIDPETTFKQRNQIHLAGLACVHEVWFWEGIDGETLIFKTEDVEDLAEPELLRVAKEYPGFAHFADYTLKRGEQFTFLNFNFKNNH